MTKSTKKVVALILLEGILVFTAIPLLAIICRIVKGLLE